MNNPSPNNTEYVLEIPYTWGFFDYQAPPLINYTAARAGHAVPNLEQPFTYCDLGCGNGVTVVMLAAAFPKAHFWGIDLNPEHIENAKQIAKRANVANVTFLSLSFGQAALHDIPHMDYITMQGIYSWVSKSAQDAIHEFIEHKAAKNCLIYLCYNAYPGATKLLPMWKVMQSFGAGSGKPVTQSVPEGLKLLQQIEALDGRFFRENPSASKRLKGIAKRDISYLVHEFGNGAFEPQFFGDLNARFEQHDFKYVGSAELSRNTHENVVSRKFSPILNEIPDIARREAAFSFIANETFRWDVYARAFLAKARTVMPDFGGLAFTLSCSAGHARGKWEMGRRSLNLDDAMSQTIIAALDGQVLGFQTLHNSSSLRDIVASDLAERLDQLLSCGVVLVTAHAMASAKVEFTKRYEIVNQANKMQLNERLFVDGRAYLASEVLGSAIRLSLSDACCVLALTNETGHAPESLLFKLLEKHNDFDSVKRRFHKTGISTHSVSKYLKEFQENTLPNLILWGILQPT